MSKKPGSKPLKAKSASKTPALKKSAPASARPIAVKAAVKTPAKAVVHSVKASSKKDSAKKPYAASKDIKSATATKPVLVPARTLATAKPVASKKTEGGTKKMAARAKVSEIVLPPGYRPAENEPFMNEMHRAYFRKRLIEWKEDILRQTRETLAILHEDSTQHADLADRATSETDRATELRTRDRQRKLISKIDAALSRIEDGTYGFCEETGEPIGLKRLDARPIATLSVEAQERHERREKVYREE